jgi:hypothetical protein
MLKILFFLVSMIFNEVTFADCPELSVSQDGNKWKVMNSAIACRSSCQKSEDCKSFQDNCGRVFVVNKFYSSDVQELIDLTKKNQCNNKLTEYTSEALACVKGQCEFVKGDCKQAKAQQVKYIQNTFSSECRDDNECSFIVRADDKCVEHLPLNNRIDISNHKLNLEYLSDKVSLSCGGLAKNRCDRKSVTQCFLNRCINVNKKIEYLNYANIETDKDKDKIKSNSSSLVVANIDEISCVKRSDCKSLLGVCGKNIITVNAKKAASLRKRIKDVEAKLNCSKIDKIYLKNPECHENLCLFK